MPDDRLQLPDSLEKALDYAKQPTTDWEMAKKRAQMWEQVSSKGRRLQWWTRWWKPMVGVLTIAAVVLAAVVVPSHLPSGNGVNNWSAASTPSNENIGHANAIQPLQSDTDALTKMYAQEGLNFIWHDQASGYDLVTTRHGANDSHELDVVRNGVVHPVLAVPDDKTVQPMGADTSPLIGFFLRDSSIPYSSETNIGPMYFVNLYTLKVNSIAYDTSKGFVSAVGIWNRRPNQMTIIYSQIDTQTSDEQVSMWDWTDQGPGEIRTLFTMNNEFLSSIQSFGSHVVLDYPHHLFTLRQDGSVQQIDAEPQLEMRTSGGSDGHEVDGFLYFVGTFTDSGISTYTGNSHAKWYSFATGQSTVLLPGVQGKEAMLASNGTQMLLQNFVADDATIAENQPVQQVQGTIQLWYVDVGKAPKLLYKKHRVGETFMAVSPGSNLGTNQMMILEDPFVKNAKPTLTFDWDTQTVRPVTPATPAKK